MRLAARLITSGNIAVFEVKDSELETRAYPGQTLNAWVVQVGRCIATKKNGTWIRNEVIEGGLWTARVTDRHEIDLLEACPACDQVSDMRSDSRGKTCEDRGPSI